MSTPERIIGEVVDRLLEESDAACVAGNAEACRQLHREYLGVRRVARAYGLTTPVGIGAHLCGNTAATERELAGEHA